MRYVKSNAKAEKAHDEKCVVVATGWGLRLDLD